MIAVVGILVTSLVVMGIILATPAGVEHATRATGDSPEEDEGEERPGTR